MNDEIQWWGYVHTNGSIQVKRYFDSRDIDEALESPFCLRVARPFHATGRDDALEKVKLILGKADDRGRDLQGQNNQPKEGWDALFKP